MYERNSQYHTLGTEKNCYIQKDGRFLIYNQNCEQKATIVKSTLMIPPRHNGIIPIKIKGHSITGQTAGSLVIKNQQKERIPT